MYHAPSHSSARESEMPTEKKRPRKQPPNQVWLDAIMSKTRSAEPSPSHAVASAEAGEDERGEWETGVPPPSGTSFGQNILPSRGPPPSARRGSRTPSPAAPVVMAGENNVAMLPVEVNRFVDQLAVDDTALVAAVTKSLKDLISEQDCSFIARGLCHLCSDKETKLVPVVNFCPEFSPTHSLCREHLRSMHRVRLVDIFAGKNQPTVSKRSLRCAVCSLSCPCSKCQLRRDVEISKYKQWLAGQSSDRDPRITPSHLSHEDDIDMEPRSRSRRTTPTPPIWEDDERGGRPHRHDPSRDHMMASDMSDSRFAYAEEKHRSSGRSLYYDDEEKPVSDAGDGSYLFADPSSTMQGLPALRAEEKEFTRSNRFPKRAAKEALPHVLEPSNARNAQQRSSHGIHSGEVGGDAELAADLASPTAASVLNCPDSEKSLVDLLSSLNQRVTPAVRYFADVDEPRFRDMMEAPAGAFDQDSRDRRSPMETERVAEVGVYGRDEYDTIMRRQKRKRDSLSSSRSSEETYASGFYPSEDTNAARASGDEQSYSSTRIERGNTPSYREKAPTPLTTADRKSKQTVPPGPVKPPSPSPRGRGSSRAKAAASVGPQDPKVPSTRKRDQLTALPTPSASSTRKRKSDSLSAPVSASTERKTPRGSAHRGHAHKSSPANQSELKRKQGHRTAGDGKEIIADDDDDDSELDTNLDYCEVCLAAGDLVCCDVCPRSFHLKCLRMTEDDLPEGDWQCNECRKPSYFESFAVTVAEKTTVPAKCLQIIQCLKSHPFSKPFLLPVENVPHYTNIVKQPMDLSTIEKKLMENKYLLNSKNTAQGASGQEKIQHLNAFAEDVRRVWSNCKLFNDDGSGITRAADQLSEGFEKLYLHVVGFVKQASTAKTAKNLGGEEQSASAQQANGLLPKPREASGGPSSSTNASHGSDAKSTGVPPKPSGEGVSESLKGADSTYSDVPPESNRVKSISSGTKLAQPPKETTAIPAAAPMSGRMDQSADKTVPLASSAAPAVRSTSPSPVTTTTSTPSPTESTTTAFSMSQVMSNGPTPEKQVAHGPVEADLRASLDHPNSTKSDELVTPASEGEGAIPAEPAK